MPMPTPPPGPPGSCAGTGEASLTPGSHRPGQTPPALQPRLLVVVATAKEYRAALSGLGAPPPPPAGETVLWRRDGRDYAVLVSGVGPVACAMAVGRAIGQAQATPGPDEAPLSLAIATFPPIKLDAPAMPAPAATAPPPGATP